MLQNARLKMLSKDFLEADSLAPSAYQTWVSLPGTVLRSFNLGQTPARHLPDHLQASVEEFIPGFLQTLQNAGLKMLSNQFLEVSLAPSASQTWVSLPAKCRVEHAFKSLSGSCFASTVPIPEHPFEEFIPGFLEKLQNAGLKMLSNQFMEAVSLAPSASQTWVSLPGTVLRSFNLGQTPARHPPDHLQASV